MSAKQSGRRSMAWLVTEGEKFRNAILGQTNYVGGRIPFPLNPTFRPNPPLTDATRRAIFAQWQRDPTYWTPRQLSQSYGISIKRVEAILKLKALEARMVADGFVVQTDYVKGMEQMLVAQSKPIIRENVREMIPSVGKPRYVAIDEDSTFTAEDAARYLNRLPFEEIQKRIENADDWPQLPFHSERVETEKPEILAQHPKLGNKRWAFMITDVNEKLEPKKREVLVRERDGVLRKATKAERRRQARKLNWI
jgi:hypothetical protein